MRHQYPNPFADATGPVSTSGAQAYADDMHRIVAVLGTTPHGFPWGTATLLVLGLLAWFAALSFAWMHLNRRAASRLIADSEPV